LEHTTSIAWFASGMNRDGNHNHPQCSFHPSLVTLVKETGSAQEKLECKALLVEVKEQLFDVVHFFLSISNWSCIYQAMMYDWLTGSTTMVISSGETNVPGSPVRPEYLKASIYFPPAFITHHPNLYHSIINIVQHYIETVGVRTVTIWS
jgi:hypothetical protein